MSGHLCFLFFSSCIDKAAVDTGKTGAWTLCSITQVEETKIILRMVPIFLSAVLGYIPVPLILNFTVQQGNTMDTRLGAVHISPATLFVIPTVFQMVILIVYDRFIVPFLRRITGYVGGVTHLQRIGIGFLSTVVATSIAALVEAKRKKVAEDSGLVDATTGIPVSVFWLTIQYFLLGVVDVTSFVGLLEFFYSEASMHYGNRRFAECRSLCRVYFIGHSAKTVFAECQIKYTRQTKTHGKIRLCRVFFSGTRQRCILPSAFVLALGKEAFCRVHFFCPRQIIFSKQFLRP